MRFTLVGTHQIRGFKAVATVAVLALVVVAAAPSAAALSGRDGTHGAHFSLRGATLTVSFATAHRARAFRGLRVRVECVQPLLQDDGPVRTLRWPRASRTLTAHLPSSPGARAGVLLGRHHVAARSHRQRLGDARLTPRHVVDSIAGRG